MPDITCSISVQYFTYSNSCSVCTQSDICMYTHCSQYGDSVRAKEIKKIGTAVSATCQGNLPAFRRLFSRGLDPPVSDHP